MPVLLRRSLRSRLVMRGSLRSAPSPSAIREGYASQASSALDRKCGCVAGRWRGGEITVEDVMSLEGSERAYSTCIAVRFVKDGTAQGVY